ncbi:beta-lactamase family protein [Paracrocinitomix mangrovi]|uniref:serine hydrolase domain-containing protein n=1 Tax=Paracrocinitomix mangrovi TaxID=2862509 RepID=UPI001C8E7F6D|nr:serine hydrolase [Paracrocinitomix mangrovi]UKN00590.1 beta-lactamase family protein [Paracrocinitomix mangrovi]
MRLVKKTLKWVALLILVLLLTANLAIIFTGRYYIYKGISATYFRGHIRPHIYDQDVFNNRDIPAGVAQPWQDSPYLAKMDLTSDERERIESLEPASFLVAYGDTVIYEEYWNEHDRSRTSNSFSMGKSVISLLIGVALDEGKIKSLDEPVANYLPEFEDEKKNITIRHLLTMCTGLSWSESYIHPFCDVAELYYDTDARDLSCNRRTIEEEPGINWRYKSGDTQVLTYVLEAATGQKVSDYASEKLWKPMGAESDAMWSLTGDENSTEKGYCCFYSTSRDFIRLGKLINNRGNWNGEQLVSASFVDEMCTIAPLIKSNGKPNNCYGYQYWIFTGLPYEVTYFRGMSGQYIISIPSKQLVIVRAGNGTEGNVVDTPPQDDAFENHYAELPFYIATGERLLEEYKKL